jgi:hypothetical protein
MAGGSEYLTGTGGEATHPAGTDEAKGVRARRKRGQPGRIRRATRRSKSGSWVRKFAPIRLLSFIFGA